MGDPARDCWCCGYELELIYDEDAGGQVCERCGASPASYRTTSRMVLAAGSAGYEGRGAPLGSAGWYLAVLSHVAGGAA